MLPILHLNGYKIANPTVLARIPQDELTKMLEGFGHTVHVVAGDDPADVHRQMATTLDTVLDEIEAIRAEAHAATGTPARPRWPMIVLRTPKGWTGPESVDGVQVEDTWRSHQVPMADVRDDPAHLAVLESWLRSYRPEELFDEDGALRAELAELAPSGERRMSASPHANGGGRLVGLHLPDFRDYAVAVDRPGGTVAEATRVLGEWVRDVIRNNPDTFRLFGPDETASNRLGAVFEATDKAWMAETLPVDEHLAPDGRVMEILSEHTCQGWLEGYLLTGRHGLFNCYEAFIHIIDSMFNQHAKWLKTTREIPWRQPIASLNYLLSSHVWRQDHNGFSHQDPGFIDHVVNKKADVIRVYLPPDANTLLSVADHCLRSRNYVNVIVAGKQPAPQWLSMDDAILHCTRGIGIWDWASSDAGGEPDVVMACAGDVPTLETLAAVAILRESLPDLRVRVVNVVDLMRLVDETEHPHGLSHHEFDAAVHHRSADRLRLPRLSVAHPSAHLPADEPRQSPCPRLQGGGHHDDAVRHGDAQRPRPISPRHRRHRPCPGPRRAGGARAPGDAGPAAARPRLHPGAWRGRSRHRRLGVGGLSAPPMRILVVNAGSSSLKLSVVGDDEESEEAVEISRGPDASREDGSDAELRDALGQLTADDVAAVGHRVVHGGGRHAPALVSDELLEEIDGLDALAPLHNRVAADAIRQVRRPPAGRAACRLLRHRLPRRSPARGSHLRAPGRLGRPPRHPPARLPWPLGAMGG